MKRKYQIGGKSEREKERDSKFLREKRKRSVPGETSAPVGR